MAAAEQPGGGQDADIRQFFDTSSNPRGIPTVAYFEDVDVFLAEHKCTIEVAIGAFTEMHQKYKLMDGTLTRQKANLKSKIPEIENTLELVQLLKHMQESEEEDTLVNYPLADTVFARARVNCNGTVYLWLGADVMVEYSYDEAIAMLERNLSNAQDKLVETSEDIDHLKNQSITLEVNMARVFNHSVKKKRIEDQEKKDAST